MVIFTPKDYWKYIERFPMPLVVHEDEEEYQKEETHQYHDKIFKETLDNKKEFIEFIKKYVIDEKEIQIEDSDIEKYNTKFITSNFKTKESDIIYKIKEKEVYFIVEHQSTIDNKMPERMLEYCLQLIIGKKRDIKINEKYPLICPIVLYTGRKKWDVPRSISEKQERYEYIKELEYPKYNLVDINDYSIEELIEEKTELSKALLFEKIKTKDEFNEVIEKLVKKGLTEEEMRCIKIMLTYSNDIRKKLDKEEIERYKKLMEGKGGEENMTNFERLFIEVLEERREKDRIAEEKGKEQKMIQIVKEMIKRKTSDEFIIDMTKIDKKQLEKIKKEMQVC